MAEYRTPAGRKLSTGSDYVLNEDGKPGADGKRGHWVESPPDMQTIFYDLARALKGLTHDKDHCVKRGKISAAKVDEVVADFRAAHDQMIDRKLQPMPEPKQEN